MTQEQARKLAWETAAGTGTMAPYNAMVNSLLRVAGRKWI